MFKSLISPGNSQSAKNQRQGNRQVPYCPKALRWTPPGQKTATHDGSDPLRQAPLQAHLHLVCDINVRTGCQADQKAKCLGQMRQDLSETHSSKGLQGNRWLYTGLKSLQGQRIQDCQQHQYTHALRNPNALENLHAAAENQWTEESQGLAVLVRQNEG